MARSAARLGRRSLLKAAGGTGAGALARSLAGSPVVVPLLSACGSGASGAAAGRLRLGTTEIMQFDPYQTNSSLHVHTFYTYLVDYADGYRPRPAGAESWAFADDHRSITLTLREGRFHSGAAITADDVVAGVARAKDPAAAFTMAEPSAFLDSATALDRRTVRLDFTAPAPKALVMDWMVAFPLVPARDNSPETLAERPSGSGPFRLASFTRDQSLVLRRNPAFWDPARPRLDTVEFRFFRDEDSLVSALESGDVDGACYLALRHAGRLRERFGALPGQGRMDLFFMNATRPPFDNRGLRQALARAVNRERVIDHVRFSLGEPIYTAFMPDSPAFDPAYLHSHGYDLGAAEALLRASGGAREATAGVGDEPGAIEILQILQADFARIGFRLTIEPMEQTAFLDELFGGRLQCCVAAQPSNLQSPSLVARGRQMLPTEDNVLLGSAVPDAYQEAVERSRTAVSPQAQRAANARLNEVLVEEAWAVGIATRPSLAAFDDGVSGLALDARDLLVLTDARHR